MCMFSSPSIPTPAAVAAPTPTPKLPDSGVQQAGADQVSKSQMAAGVGATLLTGPQGLTAAADTTANNSTKTLLGS